MKSLKTGPLSASIILFSLGLALFWGGCKDIVFNNPLDPDASAAVVEIIKVISTPLGGAGDICFDGEKLWKASGYGNLDAFDLESGLLIRSLMGEPARGIAFWAGKLYLCRGDNVIHVVDPLSGQVLERLSSADLYPDFLTGDGDALILYDQRSESFFNYRPDDGRAERLFQAAGLNPGGIALYRGDLLVTDINSESIYRFTSGGALLEVYRSPASAVGGVAVDARDYVYLFTQDGKVYKITLP